MSFFRKSGIVNVKMVITEEKILSNIDKIQKLINPNSKKQIVQLEDDSYFKDLVESIKTYLLEYPKKKNFPIGVYKAAYGLVEYATNQFEENTKQIEKLIRKREKNIKLAGVLKDATAAIKGRAKNSKAIITKLSTKYSKDVVQALITIYSSKADSEGYKEASKLIETKINNLEQNLHIEIDMERIDDRSKALSFIGIEIAEALKYIPAPIDVFESEETELASIEEAEIFEPEEAPVAPVMQAMKSAPESKVVKSQIVEKVVAPEPANIVQPTPEKVIVPKPKMSVKSQIIPQAIQEDALQISDEEQEAFLNETRYEVKPSLWQRIKNSKLVRTVKFIMKIRVVLDYPALPEGRGNNL